MANSQRTTNFGPIVSLATSKADARAPHLFLDSNSTLEVAAVTGIAFSGATSASITSAILPDGHLSIGSVSATSATLYFRSGATTYQWDAAAASVL